MRKTAEREPRREREQGGNAIQRFIVAQGDFIKVAGRFGLDPDAKLRVAEARQEMSSAAEEISKDAGLIRQAESTGIVDQDLS